jgi:hypothetical protein
VQHPEPAVQVPPQPFEEEHAFPEHEGTQMGAASGPMETMGPSAETERLSMETKAASLGTKAPSTETEFVSGVDIVVPASSTV